MATKRGALDRDRGAPCPFKSPPLEERHFTRVQVISIIFCSWPVSFAYIVTVYVFPSTMLVTSRVAYSLPAGSVDVPVSVKDLVLGSMALPWLSMMPVPRLSTHELTYSFFRLS